MAYEEPVVNRGTGGKPVKRPVKKAPYELPYTIEKADAVVAAVTETPLTFADYQKHWQAEIDALRAELAAQAKQAQAEKDKALTEQLLAMLAKLLAAIKPYEDEVAAQQKAIDAAVAAYNADRKKRLAKLAEMVDAL